MAEVICNTSPLQYLHQIGQLHLLQNLADRISVPSAVVKELAVGRTHGFDLPDPSVLNWITVRDPRSLAVLPLVYDLDAGESAVLALALESAAAKVVLDDWQARQVAGALRIPLIGTLGILLNAKEAGLVVEVKPHVEQLQQLGFRLSSHTRSAVLKLAGESGGTNGSE